MFAIDPKTNTVKPAADERAAQNCGNGFAFITSEEQLTHAVGIPTASLVEIYNARAERPVKKFQDRATAACRVWAVLTANSEGELPPNPIEEGAAESAGPAEAANDRPPTKKKQRGGRPMGTGKFAGKVVFAKCRKNPRRHGVKGWHSYEIIRGKEQGVPYDDYVAGGGRPQDLQWDIDRGWAEVK